MVGPFVTTKTVSAATAAGTAAPMTADENCEPMMRTAKAGSQIE